MDAYRAQIQALKQQKAAGTASSASPSSLGGARPTAATTGLAATSLSTSGTTTPRSNLLTFQPRPCPICGTECKGTICQKCGRPVPLSSFTSLAKPSTLSPSTPSTTLGTSATQTHPSPPSPSTPQTTLATSAPHTPTTRPVSGSQRSDSLTNLWRNQGQPSTSSPSTPQSSTPSPTITPTTPNSNASTQPSVSTLLMRPANPPPNTTNRVSVTTPISNGTTHPTPTTTNVGIGAPTNVVKSAVVFNPVTGALETKPVAQTQGKAPSPEDLLSKARAWTSSPSGGNAAKPTTASPAITPSTTSKVPSTAPTSATPVSMNPARMSTMPGQPGMSDRARRQSRINRQSRILVNNQMEKLETILANVSKLEKRIVATEAARQQAEESLIEIAIGKMEQDEKVNTALEKVNSLLTDFNSLSHAELHTRLCSLRDGLSGTEAASPSPSQSQSPPPPSSSTPPPPPPPPSGTFIASHHRTNSNTPPAPPAPRSTPQSTSNTSAPVNTMDLLAQIKSGAKLKPVDVQRLKEQHATQKAQSSRSGRKSVMLVKSLEDTIRSALQMKFQMGDDEDDDFGDEDDFE
ncbi:hypothetical protein Pelo_12801 [Pelomyxa schiedti]|nr:hypothetical protein Pelo_12801 [Pelomyxa schiedti]